VLRRDPTKPRAIEVLVGKAKAAVGPSGLPVVGQVAAGQPVLAEENIEEYVEVPSFAGGEEGEFVLRVKGDSMKDVGIYEGDHVIVRRQDTAANGEIVVALVGDEATVKRFFREDDHVRLQPENAALEPIRSRDVQVLGRVVGVCRRVS
jgi:repressor LexA